MLQAELHGWDGEDRTKQTASLPVPLRQNSGVDCKQCRRGRDWVSLAQNALLAFPVPSYIIEFIFATAAADGSVCHSLAHGWMMSK